MRMEERRKGGGGKHRKKKEGASSSLHSALIYLGTRHLNGTQVCQECPKQVPQSL